MKIKSSYFLKYWAICSIVFSSCRQATSKAMIGTWEIAHLRITMPSFKNSDSTQKIEVYGKDWEAKMKAKNIQTTYSADGRYHSLHRNLQGKATYDPAGTWRIVQDTLIIQDTIPKRITYKFKFKIKKNQIEYWGVDDFDLDGQVDDQYYSQQVKL
ncbi:hypothetical protein G9H61_12055 [Aquirufa ecclesiirivi]|uniref:Lipocalin-like domain-containing protein n=1 Tax=Aquirufa ecclesiirivi TaxID=2715124 RepID=A0ABT4JIV1_9BACT|nr:hypothetical protein [Aquirufa ecclesiirivi]MCZ2476181.1 hypothetical protein [Aquirufa ecclesiirivi]